MLHYVFFFANIAIAIFYFPLLLPSPYSYCSLNFAIAKLSLLMQRTDTKSQCLRSGSGDPGSGSGDLGSGSTYFYRDSDQQKIRNNFHADLIFADLKYSSTSHIGSP